MLYDGIRGNGSTSSPLSLSLSLSLVFVLFYIWGWCCVVVKGKSFLVEVTLSIPAIGVLTHLSFLLLFNSPHPSLLFFLTQQSFCHRNMET
jgi:hypothetical protein